MKKLAVGTLLAIGVVFVSGCAKDAKQDTPEPDGEGTRVVLKVAGIDDIQGTPALKANAGGGMTSPANKTELVKGEGFDVLVFQDNKIESQSNFVTKSHRSSSLSGALRSAAMPTGNTYRVFLREKGTTGALTTEAFTSGSTASIPVEKGKTYEWFALSYNNTAEIPAGTNGVVAVDDEAALLYASGEFSVEDTEGDVVVPVEITFKPRLTRVAIEINTMGMFAAIESFDVKVTGLHATPDAINVVTGDFEGSGEAELDLTDADFVDVDGNTFGDQKVVYRYVAANTNDAITVSVTNLKTVLDAKAGGAIRDFGGAELVKTFVPERGMEQRIVMGFVESPLVRGGVSWARSNLYYTGPVNPSAPGATMTHNPYRFYHSNPQTQDANSYFSFKGHVPRKLASANEANQKDPCALVYPKGLWKTPTAAEVGTLTSRSPSLLGDILGNLLDAIGLSAATPGASYGSEYIQFDNNYSSVPTTGVNTVYGPANGATNNIRFQYNGLDNRIDVLEELITLQIGNYNQAGAFWTSQSATDADLGGLLGDLADLGARSFIGTDRAILGGILGRRAWASNSIGLVNLDLLSGINVLSSPLMNVRCVRDASWTTASQAPGYDPMPDLSNL